VILKIAETTPESSSIFAVVTSMLMTGIRFVIFAVIVFIASRVLIWGGSQTRYIEKGIEKAIAFFGREVLFSFAILFVLFFASISEQLGAHSVVGAFFGGLLLSKDVFGKSLFSELEKTLHSMTAGFLAPIFFAYLGLHFGMSGLSDPLLLGGIS
jgi:Kef-type K+ transport system membrane component KefB